PFNQKIQDTRAVSTGTPTGPGMSRDRALLTPATAAGSSVSSRGVERLAMDPMLLDRAHAEVRRRLTLVQPDQWTSPTPCEGWSVRDLVLHMAVGGTMASQLLGGQPWTREAVVDEVSSAPDLTAEWEKRAADERAGFSAAGALDRVVKHPVMGEIPCV